MNKVIDPIYDIGFKLLFGREHVSEPLLISLLNTIFTGDPQLSNIVEVKYENAEKPDEIEEGKGIRYDVHCTTSTGHHFIVEMQKSEQTHFLERSGYYVSRATAVQGYKGDSYESGIWDFSLTPVVGVFLCNFHVRGLPKKPLTKLRLTDEETGEPIGDFHRYAFIQLPFFIKEKVECTDMMDQWIYNIKNMGSRQNVAFTTQNEIFSYLESVSNVAALNKKERDIYEASLMRARDYNAVMKTAEAKAEAKGMAEGMAKGMAEGMAKGAELEKVEMIRNMYRHGLSIDVIAAVTNFPIQKIEEIISHN
ncbi:MAG: Rpn family recombination-promoting nuclease/putative transposase [Muribaculaceae bacterium]|nr:Rpn family recombination-promoting nuclease/putative transposase [Muribaculaceae bacterium]